eukprot:6184883-Pleurochrysis_carterae.AAC.1
MYQFRTWNLQNIRVMLIAAFLRSEFTTRKRFLHCDTNRSQRELRDSKQIMHSASATDVAPALRPLQTTHNTLRRGAS